MKKSHLFTLVQNQHFKNINLSNQQIENILYSQFDLFQWFLARINWSSNQSNHIILSKLWLKDTNQFLKTYLMQKQKNYIQGSNATFSKSKKIEKVTLKEKTPLQTILIMQEKNHNFNLKKQFLNTKSYSFYKVCQFQRIKQKNINDLDKKSFIQSSNSNLICNVNIQFRSNINCFDGQINQFKAERNHIQIIFDETINIKQEYSIFEILCQFLQIDFKTNFFNPNVLMKPISANSYISLQQGISIINKQQKKNSINNDVKNFQFVFRKFHQMTTKKEYTELLLDYTKCIHQKTYQSTKKITIFQKDMFNHNKMPIHHFVCSLSNCFIPFILSLSNLFTLEQQQSYLIRYIDIIFPSYSNYFSKNKKGLIEVQLSDEKFREIKKAINYILNKLILQYSKQITILAAQLSFIFQIVELLNQSLLTKQLIDQLLLLLGHYGGLYPEILLKADEWVSQLTKLTQLKQELTTKQVTKKSIPKQNKWYELNKLISSGILTRLKYKIEPLLNQILQKIGLNKNNLTFQNHFKKSLNAFTIVSFDLTCHTVRFFNHLTTPKMKILDFLYLKQNFQCIEIQNKWTPYKICYQNQTFLINLQKNVLTVPIGVEYLQQYLDNSETRKRYFNFSNTNFSSYKKKEFIKYVFNGKGKNDKVYDQRLIQFSLKRHEILSLIKKIIFSNIPKTKLIWRFIRFQTLPQKDKQVPQSQHTIQVLKKIQLINHLYNLMKTLILHDKNVNRQVWLQSQCNLLDQVKIYRKIFIPQKEELYVLKWEIQRINHLRKIIQNQQKKDFTKLDKQNKDCIDGEKLQFINKFSTSVFINILNRTLQEYPTIKILSQTEKYAIIKQLKKKFQQFMEIIQQKLNNYKNVKKVRIILSDCLDDINSSFFTKSQQFGNNNKLQMNSIQNLVMYIEKEVMQNLKNIQKEQNIEHNKIFNTIRQKQSSQLVNQIDKHLKLLIPYQITNFSNLNQNNFEWFRIQCQYQKFIQTFLLKLNTSLSLNIKKLLTTIYFECGVKQIEIYDLFKQNFELIDKKINHNISTCFTLNYSLKNKINLVIDSKQYSQLYCSLYLRLIFHKLTKIHHNKQQFKQQTKFQELFFNDKQQIDKNITQLIPLQKYFLSFTCSGFQSIAILQLILLNNFNNKPFLNQFYQIMLKIPSYKHLLSWTSTQQVDNLFNDFHWYLIQQKQAQNFYQMIYTSSYKKQIQQKSQISHSKLNQIKKLFDIKPKSTKKSSGDNNFFKQRNKTSNYLIYQILQEWIQILHKKNNPQIKYLPQITLDQIIQNKILYNNKVIDTYSILQKKQVFDIFKKYIQKFGIFIQQILSICIDSIPHSSNQWKAILLKNALSGHKLKLYIKKLFQSYHIDPNITFQDLYNLGKQKFKGLFNIILWNCRRLSIDVCNYITKPKMPIWLAIYSACSFSFYMKEQISHHKWQGSQNSQLYSTFHQFPQNRNIMFTRQSLLKDSKQPFIKKTESKVISEQPLRFQIERNDNANTTKTHKAWVTPNFIDQQVNKYLNPSLISSYPLGYLTNPNFGLLNQTNSQSLNIFSLCFQNSDERFFCQRIKTSLFQQKQLNFSISNMFGMMFNKKDKNIKVLRQYMRRILKQSHFHHLFQTILDGNKNLYKNYSKAYKTQSNFEISEQTRKASDDFTSLSPFQQDLVKEQFQQEIVIGTEKQSKYNKKYEIKISKLQVEFLDQYGDIINRNQNKDSCSYRFYPTYQEAQKVNQYQYRPQSSKHLMCKFNDENYSKSSNFVKEQHKTGQINLRTEQNKNENIIKHIFKRYLWNCRCFSVFQQKRIKKQSKQKKHKFNQNKRQ